MMEEWMLNQLLKDDDMGFTRPIAGGKDNEKYLEAVHKFNSSLSKQIGGSHYKDFTIQPVEFCYVNNIPYLESTAIKYICRWKRKNGIQDLDKAIHFLELLKEFYQNEPNTRGLKREDSLNNGCGNSSLHIKDRPKSFSGDPLGGD